ncbi:MAG: AmmeMemoRadiSam system protein A [Gemmatimonadota bacterium]|nr:MAG: AmmeMemoRadiSam system protein A [Gemmatimonadota bacterium]
MAERSGYCVGYASVAIYKSADGKPSEEQREVGVKVGLSAEDKKLLLEIARTTIEKRVKGEDVPKFDVTSEVLAEHRGAFVTINKHGQLRGCIGYIEPIKPLHETVREMAESAALSDPRFTPVAERELKDLEIEISALTPLRKIEHTDEIEVGLHGIYIKKGYYSGLLLPQVATEYGWDRNTFLEHTCLKAGLPTDAWREKDTEIFIFSADIFSEKKQ